jgi:hypothetical protein
MMVSPTADRFLIAAVVDRLMFGAETTFGAGDARQLAQLLPHEARSGWLGRFLGLGIEAGISGGSTRGHAAGVGDVEIRDNKPRTVKLSTEDRGTVRAGQWKLRWSGRHIEIDQVADVGPLARSARLMFDRADAPVGMVQMVNREFGPFVIGTYRPWKEPIGGE